MSVLGDIGEAAGGIAKFVFWAFVIGMALMFVTIFPNMAETGNEEDVYWAIFVFFHLLVYGPGLYLLFKNKNKISFGQFFLTAIIAVPVIEIALFVISLIIYLVTIFLSLIVGLEKLAEESSGMPIFR